MDYQTILLAIDIWREDRGGNHDSRFGIGCVVRNRVAHPGWWGHTVIEVITHKWQFSSMSAPKDPNLIQWPQKEAGQGDVIWDDCISIAQEILNGAADTTGGAVEYYTAPLTTPPAEWGHVVETVVIDAVHFCKSVHSA